MKKILLLGFIALCGFGLAGCKETDTTLRTVSMFGGTDPHVDTYKEIIDSFEKETKWKVSDTSQTSNEDWKAGVIADFQSGNEADVLFFFNGATAAPIVDAKKVVSVADIRKEYPNYAKNISDSVLDPYCVPLKGFVEGLFINKELFTTDALKAELNKGKWTWDELVHVCELLKAAGVESPIAFSAKEPHYWIEHLILGTMGPSYLESFPAGSVFSKDEGEAQKYVSALVLLKELADKGAFGPSKGTSEADAIKAAFLAGQSAIYLDGSWYAGNIDGTTTIKADQTVVFPFPSIPTAKGGTGQYYMQAGFTSGFYITQKAWKNPEKRAKAVKFVEMMTSKEAINKFIIAAGGGIPADPSVVVADASPVQVELGKLSSKTSASALPLSDTGKANTFSELVQAAQSFVDGNRAETLAALKKYFEAQK